MDELPNELIMEILFYVDIKTWWWEKEDNPLTQIFPEFINCGYFKRTCKRLWKMHRTIEDSKPYYLGLSPLRVASGPWNYGADFDGDELNYYVPASLRLQKLKPKDKTIDLF